MVGRLAKSMECQAVLHPSSPVRRILVDQRMGAGKTTELVRLREQHYRDPRKKIPLSPTDARGRVGGGVAQRQEAQHPLVLTQAQVQCRRSNERFSVVFK